MSKDKTWSMIWTDELKELRKSQEATKRVRKLAEKLQKKEAFHQLTAYACAEEILKALDGEQ